MRQAEDADPRDPFTQGLRARCNDLDTERQTILTAIAHIDQQENQEPERPGIESVDTFDALPHLAVNLHWAPEELSARLFDLT